MAEWISVPLEELAADERSAISKPYGSAILKADYRDRGVPVVRGVNLTNGIFHDDNFAFIEDELAAKMPGAQMRSGDLVVTHRGTVGQVSMIPRSSRYPTYIASTSHVKVRLNRVKAVPEFYYYWFASPKGQHSILSNVSTVGVPGVVQPVATVKKLQVPWPPPTEQRAIADVLGAFDDKIAANQRGVGLLDQRSAALVAESSQAADQVRLSDVLVLNYGKPLPASTRIPGPVDVYGSGGRVGVHDVALVNQPGIVLGRKGSVGAVYWADGPHYPIDTTYFVSPVGDTSAEVLYYVLRSMPLADLNSDSAVPGLNRDEAYGQWTRVPMDESARNVTKEIESAFVLVRGVRIENEHLARTRDELLPLLMSGKLRVKDAEAVASEVL